MTAPEPGLRATPTQAEEWGAAQALLPVAATFGFYALPSSLHRPASRRPEYIRDSLCLSTFWL